MRQHIANRDGERRSGAWRRWSWTLIGAATIPLWGTWPALATQSDSLPSLEFLAISFAAASLLLWVIERHNQTSGSQRAWLVSLAFGVAEVGSAALFLVAIRRIPSAEANTAVYLWPAMLSGLAVLLKLQSIRLGQVIGIFLGFAGTLLLFASGGPLVFAPAGVGLALLAGFCWAMYCTLRLKWNEDLGAFLARGAAVAGIICLLLHFFIENSQWPSARAWLAAIAVGALPTALANIFWDLGMRRGDQQLLTVLAYGAPLSGAVFLSLFGLEPFTWRILAAGLLVGVAGFLSTTPFGPNAPVR